MDKHGMHTMNLNNDMGHVSLSGLRVSPRFMPLLLFFPSLFSVLLVALPHSNHSKSKSTLFSDL